MIPVKRLEELVGRFPAARVAVIGDFCLDVYWFLESLTTEHSVETNKPIRKVNSFRYTPGGAGNVVANLVALGCREIHALGVLGDDLHGRELVRLLADQKVDTSRLIIQQEDWQTPTYCKPYFDDNEQERLDFGSRNSLASKTEALVCDALERILPNVDALIVNQQLPQSIWSGRMVNALIEACRKYKNVFAIADTRDPGLALEGVALQINEAAAARITGSGDKESDQLQEDVIRSYGKEIFMRTQRPVLITRGERGSMVFSDAGVSIQPGLLLFGACDPVGAGDSTLAAFAVSVASGATWPEAAAIAAYASGVTVQKLRVTGTASPEELLEIGRDPNFVFCPEKAEDLRTARYEAGSEIEIITENLDLGHIRHAVFDWDGTVSTLREGWEEVMEPMMVRAILGNQFDQASEGVYQKVCRRVRSFIDKTTGIQTIVQMQMLVELVKEFGLVPANEVLDQQGYKEIYNKALLEMVHVRLDKLKRKELQREDFCIKGAYAFLSSLKKAGIRLYLASGTDHDDVVAEAEALGCSSFFEGGIYGSVGDIRRYSKKRVLEQIMKENGLHGPELVVFGDGPVEVRECQKKGGVAVGVASDEVRRYGLSIKKRERLIKAGADIVLPDFSQGGVLFTYLNVKS